MSDTPAKRRQRSRPRETADSEPSAARPDQEARRTAKPADQYVRLRVRVRDGEMSIVGSHLVDGPLVQSSTFLGRYAYEVTEGGRLLHAESIPDLGVVRGFAHPKGTVEQQRHHTYELSTYEFDVRVPAKALTRDVLPRIEVVLHRVKDPLHPPMMAAAPLGVQYARELREVARVVGIPASVLPPALSKATRRPSGERR